ncbi:MAG: GNAT family N-acetyltransferase [Streptosporangiaceae bacterium]|jgi:GNAT superfamily N-acetyltransferase
MTGPGLVIRQLTLDDDLQAEIELRRQAFGPLTDADRDRTLAMTADSVSAGRHLGVFDRQRMIGAARYLDMRQWWHGRSVPMAGVSGVKVAPEDRGRGVGKALMTELLGLIAGRGYPVSVLYPATTPIYRSLGWELAGGQYEAVLPSRSLGSLLPPDVGAPPPTGSLRRAGPDDAAEVVEVVGAVHEAARHCGAATRTAADVRRWLSDPHLSGYLAGDGFLAYRWHGDNEILVEWAVAASAQTTRAMWAVVGSHASIASRVRAQLSPDDPVGWLTREADLGLVDRRHWMLRVLDARAAIAARGFPAAAGVAAAIRLDDASIPANSGRWLLEVSGGKGTLNPGRTDNPGPVPAVPPVSLGARGFAALFAGTPLQTLRTAGLAAGGDPVTDDALDCAFAGTPFLLDYF